MWHPSTLQWAVLALAIAALNVMALGGRSLQLRAAIVILDAALVIWWLEARQHASDEDRAHMRHRLRGFVYVLAAITCSAILAYVQHSDENAARLTGRTIGTLLLPLIITVLVKRFGKARESMSVARWLFVGTLIMGLVQIVGAARSVKAPHQDPMKLVIDAMKEAAGTKPIESRANVSDRQMAQIIRGVMTDLLSFRRRHEAESAEYEVHLAKLYSAATFSSRGAIEAQILAVRGVATLDREMYDRWLHLPETIAVYAETSSLKQSDKAEMVKGATEALASSDVIASLREASAVEDQWADATVNLYKFASAHLRDVVVREETLQIADDGVRDEFNALLSKAEELQQKLVAINNKYEQQQRSGMQQMGLTPADLGIK